MMENDWRHSQCSKVELNLRVADHPEGGQTGQYKRVFRY
jgi:hypothetical protein